MRTILSLNGQWEGCYWVPGEPAVSFEGTVPGCAHTDLLAAGMLSDIYLDKQSMDCQFVETAVFEYKKEFDWNEDAKGMHLHFACLDTFCDVWLNDIHLGFCDNMFLEWDFEVEKALKRGKNCLKVRFYPPAEHVKDYPEYEASFTTERIHIRRMQCTFGWDWVERYVTMGMEGNVELRREEEMELDGLYVATTALDAYGAELEIKADFAKVTSGKILNWSILAPNGDMVWQQERAIVEPVVRQAVSIANPKLWWPNGYGSQPLYTFHVELQEKDGSIYKEENVRFGIRTIRVLELEDPQGSANWLLSKEIQSVPHIGETDHNERYFGFRVLVNGKPIFCQGANWVPCEPFPSAVTERRLRDLLNLAVEGHLNMLRVWGGGIIESDTFYNICDELGILVTQDFLMACGQYPEEKEEFIRTLYKEAETAVRRIRNHPSLAWWTGDNENSAEGNMMQEEYRGRRAAHLAAEPAISKYDPYRRFMPSTPFGGTPYKSMTSGTGHSTMHVFWMFNWFKNGDLADYHEVMDSGLARFNNEVPVFGAPALSSMKRFLSEEHLYEDEYIEFHTKNNPVGILKEFPIYYAHKAFAEKMLGDFRSEEDKVGKLQCIQYEWVRHMIELYRRNREYASGILFWMFDDCWPANSWSLVDFYANPKSGWYAMRHTCQPLMGSMVKKNGTYEVSISNESPEEVTGMVRISMWDVEHNCKVEETTFPFISASYDTKVVGIIDWQLPEEGHVLVMDLVDGEGTLLYRTNYFPKRIRDMHLASQKGQGGAKIVERGEDFLTLETDTYVQMVNIDGDYIFEDNYFTMLPGERRIIAYRKTAQAQSDEIMIYNL